MTARRKPAADTPAPPEVEIFTAQVPLSQLYLHALNTRTEPPAADIEALAESIRAIGLLQNLSGFQDATADPGRIGIVAGGRRLRALQMLAGDTDPLVPVRITGDQATARIWASAENAARMALHPADEIAAYGRMAATGAPPQAIARAFAVTEAHVRRRLKLADLPEPALAALRAGRISLDQAAALTVARTAEDALRVLENLQGRSPGSWGTGPDAIRQELQQATLPATDRRARFVGMDAYRAAGGTLQADLFTDQTRLLDPALLDLLFAEKLDAAAAAERATGWAWVETLADSYIPYGLTDRLQRVQRTPVDLPEGDADELEDLERLAETEELTPAQLARRDMLETRAAGFYADADIASSGVFLHVDHHGDLVVSGAYRRPQDRPAPAADADAGAATVAPAETRALPAALLEDLRRIRRIALEVELLDCPGLMLDLLAFSLQPGFWPHETPVMIQPTAAPFAPEKTEGLDLPARLAAFETRDKQRGAATVAAFQAFGRTDLLGPLGAAGDAITLAATRCLRPGSALEAYVASLVTPNVRAIWTPTKDGYLARLPVPVLDAIWSDLVPRAKAPHRAWDELKKAQKAAELHDLFNSADYREALGLSRDEAARIDAWTPPELQWPEAEAGEG